MSCVIFAKDTKCLAAFYQQVLAAEIVESAKSHTVLSSKGVELVVHGIPAAVAKKIHIEEPPAQRITAPVKPVFVIDSLQRVNDVCQELGGGMKSMDLAWDIRGYRVLDGWDPEGNIVQFKEAK